MKMKSGNSCAKCGMINDAAVAIRPCERWEEKVLPKDPIMLLSYINTGLRDKYEDLEDMASSEGFDAAELTAKLEAAGYRYDDSAGKRRIGQRKNAFCR